MEAILKFNLPEEQSDFLLAQRGTKYLCMINEFDNYLRRIDKYENNSDEVEKKIQEIREQFNEIFHGYHDDIE